MPNPRFNVDRACCGADERDNINTIVRNTLSAGDFGVSICNRTQWRDSHVLSAMLSSCSISNIASWVKPSVATNKKLLLSYPIKKTLAGSCQRLAEI
jgi:hypothetical protein